MTKVWSLVSDLSRMPRWSPQCRLMKALGPVRPGTRTVNLNRRNNLFWPTTSTITEVIPERKLAFRVNANNTVWSYELEPTATGTRVVETRHAENGVKAVSTMTVNAVLGGVSSFEQELVEGMNTSLARIKAAAEEASSARPGRLCRAVSTVSAGGATSAATLYRFGRHDHPTAALDLSGSRRDQVGGGEDLDHAVVIGLVHRRSGPGGRRGVGVRPQPYSKSTT